MDVSRPFDKLPVLNSAAILLVGSNEGLQQELAKAMLREKKSFKINIHLATSLPLPSEGDHLRPRIDLIVFVIDIKSKYSLKNVEASLAHVAASFFLGKVCFLVTGGAKRAPTNEWKIQTVLITVYQSLIQNVGSVNYCSVEMSSIWKLGEVYCSPVLYCELELEKIRVATAQRLLRMLQICAGHVPGVSALAFNFMLRNSY